MSEEQDKAVSELLARIGREIRNPLSAVITPVEALLSRSDVPKDILDQLDGVRQGGRTLDRMLSSMLDLSIAEQGRNRARLEEVDLPALTGGILALYRENALKSGITIHSSLPSFGPVYVDAKMWQEMVLQLVLNAMKWTFQGSISVGLERAEGQVVLSVADTGAGIAAEHLPSLFKSFYRVPDSEGRSHEGLGVGLSVVKTHAEAMQGAVEVTSEVGVGTTFLVRIPDDLETRIRVFPMLSPNTPNSVEAYLDEATRWLPDNEEDAAPTVSKVTRLRLQKLDVPGAERPRIVVAEGNLAIRNLITQILAPYYEVVATDGGNAAIQAMRGEKGADLIIASDYLTDMPSGALVKSIRGDRDLRGVPILVLTDRDREDWTSAIPDADDYTSKPVAPQEVLSRVRNLLERSRLRAEKDSAILQAQKMEAIGQLTGGISHDFANLLVAIQGSIDVALREVTDERLRKLLGNAEQAARRGRKLTNHLMNFSQKREARFERVNVNELISSMIDLLQRTIGQMVGVSTRLSSSIWATEADPAQIELVVLNLAINARDAMPDGGELTVTTSNVEAAGDRTVDMVRISVTDTGSGMDEEVLERAFEPFFTTKGVGAGSGMGLPQVKQLIEAAGGEVNLTSGVGKGTTVEILLPRNKAIQVDPKGTDSAMDEVVDGALRILLVDDDEDVLEVATVMVDALGHEVTAAANGQQALAALEANKFDLLIADYAMPGMTGLELATRARAVQSGLKVLFATGFADTTALSERKEVVLNKPFDIGDLSVKISRAMADRPKRSADIVQLRR